ncbi:MAG: response regulator [Candidatus Sulfotelmatobacter sp.]|jgi:CheY-like chemotaxis protein
MKNQVRILVVDDGEPIREIMAVILGSEGFRCQSVPSGVDALKLLESGERFDLITSDIVNPGMDGHSFLKEVRHRFPEIPTLVITECRDIPGSLLKPFEREQLVLAVRHALDGV